MSNDEDAFEEIYSREAVTKEVRLIEALLFGWLPQKSERLRAAHSALGGQLHKLYSCDTDIPLPVRRALIFTLSNPAFVRFVRRRDIPSRLLSSKIATYLFLYQQKHNCGLE